MKVRLFYHETISSNGLHRSLWDTAIADGPSGRDVGKYLLTALHTNLPAHSTHHVESVLARVAKIESGELNEYECEGQGFIHHITRSRVRFEHTIFGECPEWPIWCCTFAQYKTALQGYRRFLDLPKSIDSELTIELPDGEPENCH